MAANTIVEHPGNEAGRVTIVTTLTSLLPPVIVSIIVIVAFLVGILSAEVAGVSLLSVLGVGALTTGTVFGTAKNTKSDRVDVVREVVPVAAPDLSARAEAAAAEAIEQETGVFPGASQDDFLEDAHTGSTVGGTA